MTKAIEMVQQCYAEFGKGNVEGVLNLLHEDVLWIDPGYPEIPYAGKCSGKNEVMNFFIGMSRTVSFTRFEPQEFYNDGEMVTVKGYFTGHGVDSKKAFETEWVMLWKVSGGKIKYYQAFIDTYNVAIGIKG